MFYFSSAVIIFGILFSVNCSSITQRATNNCDSGTLWQCEDGKCIDASKVCDGAVNCEDSSDESTYTCISITCPDYAFKCMYGACVAGTAECNGIQDCVDRSDELTENCATKTLAQLPGKCGRNQFQCDNGECISMNALCDGPVNCTDGSDEIVKYCAASPCPQYAFRCGNGACISGRAKCDRKNDCADRSDENHLLCNYPKPVYSTETIPPERTSEPSLSGGRCRADNIPDRGDAYHLANNKSVTYGELINNFQSVKYRCIERHVLEGNETNICISGKWKFPKLLCKPKCDHKDIEGVTIQANTCFKSNPVIATQCTKPADPGTIAEVTCKKGYVRTESLKQILTCGPDGRWSPLPARCDQICGEEGGEATPYIVGGYRTDIAKAPWHAGIYKKMNADSEFEQWCGGSIIHAKLIVSAMHCFWDAAENIQQNIEHYMVAVGKSKRDFSAREDLKEQFLSIDQIFYEEGYNDYAGNFANDIVIILVNKPIEFKSYIAPICIELGLEYDDRMVTPGLVGNVVGWGLEQSSGLPSPILKKIELPVVSREECRSKTPSTFHKFITSDKFCAGHLTGVSVCQGDSGGGLVFPNTVGSSTKYYLRGIVSTGGNKAGSCDNDKYTTFTNVAYYSALIQRQILKYVPPL